MHSGNQKARKQFLPSGEEFKKKPMHHDGAGSEDEACQDTYEPDCDRCELEKKPDCAHCGIILQVCLNCPENKTCEFRISG